MVDSKKGEGSGDTIEINLNFLRKLNVNSLKKNPWILATGILLIILIVVWSNGGLFSGEKVSANEAGQNLVNFINSQSQTGEQIALVSASKQGELYEVIISAGGQQVPVYVTLDGKNAFLASDVIPLESVGNVVDTGDGGNTGSVESIEIGDSPVKGSESAEVTIIEFSDYECPFCKKFYTETLGQIESNYIDSGKVRLVYKDFPLNSIHSEAQKSAEAARCVRKAAGDSDEAYYKMHDKLFENQEILSVANYKKWAREISGVNAAEFDACLNSGEMSSRVNADLAYGGNLGISGTPGFFVGNDEQGYTMLSGAQPYNVFEQVIEGYSS